MAYTIIFCFVGTLLLVFAVMLISAVHIVREDTRLTVYRLGRNIGDLGPGIVFLIPLIDKGEIKKLGVHLKSLEGKNICIQDLGTLTNPKNTVIWNYMADTEGSRFYRWFAEK